MYTEFYVCLFAENSAFDGNNLHIFVVGEEINNKWVGHLILINIHPPFQKDFIICFVDTASTAWTRLTYYGVIRLFRLYAYDDAVVIITLRRRREFIILSIHER